MNTETFLITGASRGIGFELARQLLASGRHVIATCRDPESATFLHRLQEESSGDALRVIQLDVTDPESVSQLAKQVDDLVIDVLVNNAGIMGGERQHLDDMDYGAWLLALEVNAIAPFRIIEALRHTMQNAERPRIVTFSSQMGALNRKSKGSFAYRTSKAAVNKVMQVLALELEDEGIIVCPVHPGWVRTDMGGPQADISTEESVAGIIRLIDSLETSQTGRFWTWDGREHPW